MGQTLMVQVAKRGASVLKRRKSRNRMDSSSANNNNNNSSANNDGQAAAGQVPPRSESADGDVVFYTEEPRAGEYTSYKHIKVPRNRKCIIIIYQSPPRHHRKELSEFTRRR